MPSVRRLEQLHEVAGRVGEAGSVSRRAGDRVPRLAVVVAAVVVAAVVLSQALPGT